MSWIQTGGPLAQGNGREDTLAEPGSPFFHAAATTGRAETAPLAGERYQPIMAASGTMDVEEPFPQVSTPEIRVKLPLDERRKGPSVRFTGGPHLGSVVPHAAMKKGLIEGAWLVGLLT